MKEFDYLINLISSMLSHLNEEQSYNLLKMLSNHIDGIMPYYSYDELEKINIEELDFSVRTWNCLRRAGIDNLRQLVNKSANELYKIRNLGRKCLQEIRYKLRDRNLYLKGD